MKVLYGGFDLCSQHVGQHDHQWPAPSILAMFARHRH
jgi:hypothetical protein